LPACRRVRGPSRRRGELERVSDQVRDDLLDPRLVGVDPDRIEAALQAMSAETARGLEHCERTRHHGGQVDRAALEHDLAHDRAPGVEQIVGEAREMLHLPRDDGARLPRRFRIDPRMVEEVARVGDRAERVAQLVAEHRQNSSLARLAASAAVRASRSRRRSSSRSASCCARSRPPPRARCPPRGSPDRRRRRHHGLAPAERLRGGAQPGHRRSDAAGDGERRNHPERDRE
jgi:hypothetical protein